MYRIEWTHMRLVVFAHQNLLLRHTCRALSGLYSQYTLFTNPLGAMYLFNLPRRDIGLVVRHSSSREQPWIGEHHATCDLPLGSDL